MALPGGVLAGTVEAAEVLVRAPHVTLVVDGYNVAMLGWPGLALAEQRVRLLDALDEVAARFSVAVHVVFDGADVDQGRIGRRHLRVEFSAAGVTADDVIADLVRSLPLDRPVVVVTNDAELRSRCRPAGVTVMASDQLLALARRAV